MQKRILTCVLLAMAAWLCTFPLAEASPPRRVVLLGASVGEAWDLPHAARRMKRADFAVAYSGLYDFDKTPALDKVLARPPRPDAVIIKECAAYFPGDLPAYQKLVKGWVARCRRAGVRVILTTSCTVTQRGEQLRAIAAYNDWIRAWAARETLVVLDLEAGVRRSAQDRRLRADFAQEDGLHLVDAAYRRLDPILFQALDRAFPR